MFDHINKYLKAHMAGLGAALALLLADLNTGNSVTGAEWLAIVGAYLGVGAVVAVVPNAPAVAEDYPVADSGAQDDAVVSNG